MNRNLLLFAVFLAVLGIVFDFYLLTFFGLLLIIPAAMIPSKPPTQTSQPTSQQPRRTSSPRSATSMTREEAPHPSPQSMAQSVPQYTPQPMAPTQPAPYLGSYQSYSPSLFPTSIFPSLSISGMAAPQPQGEPAKKQSERDELVEVGAMLALLKLLLG